MHGRRCGARGGSRGQRSRASWCLRRAELFGHDLDLARVGRARTIAEAHFEPPLGLREEEQPLLTDAAFAKPTERTAAAQITRVDNDRLADVALPDPFDSDLVLERLLDPTLLRDRADKRSLRVRSDLAEIRLDVALARVCDCGWQAEQGHDEQYESHVLVCQ